MTNSVIIPAYNAGAFLRDVLDTIEAQTIKPDEILVGVDGCTDTWHVAQGLKRLGYDFRLYWFANNNGPYLVRNTLATLAWGDILHFFDADDIMHHDHIQVMSDIQLNQFKGAGGVYFPPSDRQPPCHGVMSIHKDDFIKHNGFEGWRCGADTEAIYRWQHEGMERVISDYITVEVRRHDGQLTQTAPQESPDRQKASTIIRQRAISPKHLTGLQIAKAETNITHRENSQTTRFICEKPYRIVMVSDHCCIRVVKQTVALMSAGHEVVNLCRRVANSDMGACLGMVKLYETKEDLQRALLGLQSFDIFHVHNEPSWLGSFVKDTVFNKPVVFDAHDLNAVRNNKPDPEEYKALTQCDASIYVSTACLDDARRHYDIAHPTAVIYSACNIGCCDIPRETPRHGIVYEGAVSDGKDFPYLDYRNTADTLSNMGIPFHVYGASNQYTHLYPSAMVHPTHRYEALISELSRYDWGLVAPGKPHRQWRNTIPNKLFEYIAAGTPVICWQADESSALVEQYGIGVTVTSLSQIPAIYNDHNKYRRRVIEVRKSLTMEAQVQTIETLYGELLHDQA